MINTWQLFAYLFKSSSDKEGQGIVHSKTEFFSKTSPLLGASSQLPPPPSSSSSSSSSAPQTRPLPQPHLTGSESFSSNLLKATSPCSKSLASRSKLVDNKGGFNAVSFNGNLNVSLNVNFNVGFNVNFVKFLREKMRFQELRFQLEFQGCIWIFRCFQMCS